MKLKDLDENWNRRDAYQRDYDSSVSGFGHQPREIDDESNLWYIYKDGRLKQKMISNHQEREARAMGFRDSKEAALKVHGIVKSKYHQGKWIQNQGGKWVEVHPFGKPEGVTESASAGATSSASIASVPNPDYANNANKKPVKSVSALDQNQVSLFGGPMENMKNTSGKKAAIIKRR